MHALTAVLEKADSVTCVEVHAPARLHKYIIGKNGVHIKELGSQNPLVSIQINSDAELIEIEGPPAAVESARAVMQKRVDELIKTMSTCDVEVDPAYHRHLIGKGGQNASRLRERYGVQVNVPADGNASHTVTIQGPPEGVAQAKEEILQLVAKKADERTVDIIIERRLHKNIIGAKVTHASFALLSRLTRNYRDPT